MPWWSDKDEDEKPIVVNSEPSEIDMLIEQIRRRTQKGLEIIDLFSPDKPKEDKNERR